MRDNEDLAFAFLADDDGVTQVADTAFHLNPVVQKLLKRGHIEDLVGSRLRSIDDELMRKSSQCCPNIKKRGIKRNGENLMSDLGLFFASSRFLYKEDSSTQPTDSNNQQSRLALEKPNIQMVPLGWMVNDALRL